MTGDKTWHHHGESLRHLAGYFAAVAGRRAKLIGRRCRTTPKDIAELNATLRALPIWRCAYPAYKVSDLQVRGAVLTSICKLHEP